MRRYHIFLQSVIYFGLAGISTSFFTCLFGGGGYSAGAAETSSGLARATPKAVVAAPLKQVPVPSPSDRTLPAQTPIYPGARQMPLKALMTKGHQSALVAQYLSRDSFEKIAAFYAPLVNADTNDPQFKPLISSVGFKMTQGWFKNLRRDRFLFRVLISSPAYDPESKKNDVRATSIQYFMDTL